MRGRNAQKRRNGEARARLERMWGDLATTCPENLFGFHSHIPDKVIINPEPGQLCRAQCQLCGQPLEQGWITRNGQVVSSFPWHTVPYVIALL